MLLEVTKYPDPECADVLMIDVGKGDLAGGSRPLRVELASLDALLLLLSLLGGVVEGLER